MHRGPPIGRIRFGRGAEKLEECGARRLVTVLDGLAGVRHISNLPYP